VRVRQAEIDDMLNAALADEWPLDRVELVLRGILRAGVCELVSARGVPARAIINEYVDLAHAFYAGAEPGMVNGVLDKLARRLRPDEFVGHGAEAGRGGPAG